MSTFRPTNNSFRYARAACVLGLALVFCLGLMELGQEEVSGRRRLPERRKTRKARLRSEAAAPKIHEYDPTESFETAPQAWKDTFESQTVEHNEGNKKNFINRSMFHSKKMRHKASKILAGVGVAAATIGVGTGVGIATGGVGAVCGIYPALFGGIGSHNMFKDTHLMRYTFRIGINPRDKKLPHVLVKMETGKFVKTPLPLKPGSKIKEISMYKFKVTNTQYASLKAIEEPKVKEGEKKKVGNSVIFKLKSLRRGRKICNRRVYYNAPILSDAAMAKMPFLSMRQETEGQNQLELLLKALDLDENRREMKYRYVPHHVDYRDDTYDFDPAANWDSNKTGKACITSLLECLA